MKDFIDEIRRSAQAKQGLDGEESAILEACIARLEGQVTALHEFLLDTSESGTFAIRQERRRQIVSEKWTADHDDRHDDGSLADAASVYTQVAAAQARGASHDEFEWAEWLAETEWPWDKEWWKPKDQRSNLVRAGALIAAEIDRIDRARGVEVSV